MSLWYGWWGLVVLGIAGRMGITVADGLIAESYNKKTRIGPYLNRLPQEIGDAMLFFALFNHADAPWVGAVLACAWIVFDLGQNAAHVPEISVTGPAGSRIGSR